MCPRLSFSCWLSFHCAVAESCLTLCDPMDCSTPGFPVLHYLLKIAQTHVHRVGDAVQPFHSLSSPSPPALSLQGLFQRVGSLHQAAKVLELSYRRLQPIGMSRLMGKCKQDMLPVVVNLDSWIGIMERLCGNLLKLFAVFCEWIHLIYFLLSSGFHLLAAAPVNLVCAKAAAARGLQS